MTPQELYQSTVKDLQIDSLHPVHEAILEECCENAANNRQNVTDKESLLHAVRVAFLTCDSLMKSTIRAGLEVGDTVTINYRGRTFNFNANSKFIKLN